jgi:hypothetical protein
MVVFALGSGQLGPIFQKSNLNGGSGGIPLQKIPKFS